MALGNFFKGIVAQVNPFDKGKTFGTYNPSRKRREDEERQHSQSQPTQSTGLSVGVAQPTRQISVQQPENRFNKSEYDIGIKVTQAQDNRKINLPKPARPLTPEEQRVNTVNKGLDAGKSWEDIARENQLDLDSVREYSQATRPDYGIRVEKPKQSIGNRFRDIFDANTQADQWRRQQGNRLRGDNKSIVLENPGNIGTATRDFGIEAVKGVGRGIRAVTTTPIEAARSSLAQVTGNKEAERMADYRMNVNLFGREVADKMARGENLGIGDAAGALDIISVLPAAAGAKYAASATKAGLAQGGRAGTKIASSGILRGADDAFLGVRDVRNIGRSAYGKVRGRGVVPSSAAVPSGTDDLDDAAIAASAEAAIQATRPRPITVASNIPVDIAESVSQPINVRNMTEPKPLIQEITGDATTATPDPLIQRFADEVREEAGIAANNASRPNQRQIDRFEGITPQQPEAPYQLDPKVATNAQDKLIDDYAEQLRQMGEGNGTQLVPDGEGGYYRTSNNVRFGDTKGKRMTKAMWREEAERQLRAGRADPAFQREFNDVADPEVQSMLAKGEQPDAPAGRPIKVREERGIDVVDRTDAPANLPETPGTVRVTTQADPQAVKTQAAAETQSVYVEASKSNIPVVRDTANQYILDNPKQFTKRQVAAARNQRKLAERYAKEQEKIAEANMRVNQARNGQPTTASDDGFAPTGKYRQGKRGNIYEAGSRQAEAEAGAREMANRPVIDLLEEVSQKGQIGQSDVRKIRESLKRLKDMDGEHYRQNPEYNELEQYLFKGGSDAARQMALIERVQRRTASSDALTARWDRKIGNALDDPSKITEEDLASIQKANDEFTVARDNARKAEEAFRQNDSAENAKLYKQAQDAEKAANIRAIDTELTVAKRLLKGEKNPTARKVIDELETEADIKMMDYVTASQLSGPATGFRNWFGTEAAGLENRIGANVRAKITKAIPWFDGANVGGFDRASARAGRKEGLSKMIGDYKRRQDYAGRNPLQHAKNIGTTMNTGGESSMASQVQSRLGAYYKNQLKEQGYSGEQLTRRTEFMRRTDPDSMGSVYQDAVMKSSGLSGIFGKARKLEGLTSDWIAKGLENTNLVPAQLAGKAGRAISRLALGYPTAVGNFLWQSGKRAALGTPSLVETGIHLARGDKAAAAKAFDQFLKEAGSGAAMTGLGVVLGQAGMISGSYPDDPDERARWERDGISEHSIKIGNDWRPIPQSIGMLGLPIMVGAAIGENPNNDDALKELFARDNITKLMPQDQVQGFLKIVAGDGTEAQEKNFVASTIRSGLPLGSLFNQVSKGLDPTKNDTTTKDFWNNVFDQVVSGVPGQHEFADIPDKTSDTGQAITNPSFMGVMTGATTTSQEGGVQRSQEINDQINSQISQIDGYGLLSDPNMEGVLEETGLEAYQKLQSGKRLDESDIKALKTGLVKGVDKSGSDTAYLEREQYDTNLAVLKLKRDMLAEDKTTAPSDLEKLDLAIKRGEVYKEHQIPYNMISDYKSVGVEEWRKMGIPPGEKGYDKDLYDPDMYQKLWDIDQLMTKAGVSYRKGALDKNKYFLKESKSGSGSGGSGGSRKYSTEFGKITGSGSSPINVRSYASMLEQARSGSTTPLIKRTRPNIVHRIGTRGYN